MVSGRSRCSVLILIFFFLFSFSLFFLNCRRKGLSVNAYIPQSGTLDIFSCLFKVLKFLTTHPFMCKPLASREWPCSPNAVLFLPSSKSSLAQLHLPGLGDPPNPTATPPSPFPPLLIGLWLAEVSWGSPCPRRGRFRATLPLSQPRSCSSDGRLGAAGMLSGSGLGDPPARKGSGCCYFTP